MSSRESQWPPATTADVVATEIDTGREARFGKATISREGMSLGGPLVPFDDIQDLELNADRLTLRRKGRRLRHPRRGDRALLRAPATLRVVLIP